MDTTAPETTIDSAPDEFTNQTTADFSFSSTEGGGTFECAFDEGSWVPCDNPKSYPSLNDASHLFEVRAVDAAGNKDPIPASWNFTVDTIAPQTTFTSAPGPYVESGGSLFFGLASS